MLYCSPYLRPSAIVSPMSIVAEDTVQASSMSVTSRSGFFWRLIGLAVALAVGFFTSILDLTLGRAGHMPVQPTYLALLMVAVFATFSLINAVKNRSQWGTLVKIFGGSAPQIFSYSFIAAFSLLFSAFPQAFWEDSGKWILLIPYGYVIWIGTLIIVSHPLLAVSAQYGLRLGFILISSSVIYEIFYPGSFSNLLSRASGFAGNSNFGALATCMLCAAVLRYGEKKHRLLDLCCLSVTGIAVLATQSRSGMVEFAVVIGFWGLAVLLDKNFSVKEAGRLVILALLTLLLLIFSVRFVFEQGSLFSGEGNRFARILSGKSVDDGSGDERVGAAKDALRLIAEAPFFGHGTGHTRTMRVLPHNQYLQQWVNNGLCGLLAYLTLLVSAWILFYKKRSFAGMTFISVSIFGSLFSHNLLDQRSFIIPLAILLGGLFQQSLDRVKIK